MTTKSYPNLPRDRLDVALAVMQKLGTEHLLPIFRAVRDHKCANFAIAQCSAKFEMPPMGKPIIAIVCDDMLLSFGPSIFPCTSLRQLVGHCSVAAIMPGRPCVAVYEAAASAAAVDRRHVVLIETAPAKVAEWKAFLHAANPGLEMIEASAARGAR